MQTAILVDGSYFLKRYRILYSNAKNHDAPVVAKTFYTMVHQHLIPKKTRISAGEAKQLDEKEDLYRIFYYDCYPFAKKVHNPITKKCIDFSKTPQASFRLALFNELKKLRKVALRLGYIADHCGWTIKPDITKSLFNKKIKMSEVTENDVVYDMTQKGIDIKIGLDIASLAYKKQVKKIILIAGDSDFVPAAKLARREGIDFVLDPMWNHINPELYEHIDGLRSVSPKPKKK